jgi:hypothetical protein
MSLYYKKVDAVQFKLTDTEKESIKNRKAVYFENGRVKHIGGNQYIAVLQQGENLIKISEQQWLVKSPDGMMQIYWPDRFNQQFIKGDEADSIQIGNDLFRGRPVNQPNALI